MKAGIYIINYHAEDNARPVVNSIDKQYFINVIDRENPVITVDVNGSLRAAELVTLKTEVEDDTDCDVTIIIVDNNGLKTVYSSNTITFVPQSKGQYNITIRAEDAYGNVAIKNLKIDVAKEAFNKVLRGWIVIGSAVGGLFILFIGLTIAPKIKKEK